jgi:hypothetical protein
MSLIFDCSSNFSGKHFNKLWIGGQSLKRAIFSVFEKKKKIRSWPKFSVINCREILPNGHNFPLTELNCKCLGILESYFNVEIE